MKPLCCAGVLRDMGGAGMQKLPDLSVEVPLRNGNNSLEYLGNGRILLYFLQSGVSLQSLDSPSSLESLENGLFGKFKRPFPKDPLFRTQISGRQGHGGSGVG